LGLKKPDRHKKMVKRGEQDNDDARHCLAPLSSGNF